MCEYSITFSSLLFIHQLHRLRAPHLPAHGRSDPDPIVRRRHDGYGYLRWRFWRSLDGVHIHRQPGRILHRWHYFLRHEAVRPRWITRCIYPQGGFHRLDKAEIGGIINKIASLFTFLALASLQYYVHGADWTWDGLTKLGSSGMPTNIRVGQRSQYSQQNIKFYLLAGLITT